MSKRNDETIMIEREQIDADIEALETFSVDHDGLEDFAVLLCAFHNAKGARVRFATLVQLERLRRLLKTIYVEQLPQLIERCEDAERANLLMERQWPMFVASIVKLSDTRARQSESGRGAFGRQTVAKLQERLDRANAELLELRHGQVHVESTAEDAGIDDAEKLDLEVNAA